MMMTAMMTVVSLRRFNSNLQPITCCHCLHTRSFLRTWLLITNLQILSIPHSSHSIPLCLLHLSFHPVILILNIFISITVMPFFHRSTISMNCFLWWPSLSIPHSLFIHSRSRDTGSRRVRFLSTIISQFWSDCRSSLLSSWPQGCCCAREPWPTSSCFLFHLLL